MPANARHRITLRLVALLRDLLACALLLPLLAAGLLRWATRRHRYTRAEAVPPRAVALVLGAGVTASGHPSPILDDRILAAVELWRLGRVQRLLLSGGPGRWGLDEPAVMAARAHALGVPEAALLRDAAGLRTFASCANARRAGVTGCVVVTQAYHLPRAVFLARRLGLDAVGLAADRRRYRDQRRYQARELLSSVRALWDALAAR